MYSDRRGTDKNHPGQNLRDKRPPDKTREQKPPRKIEREFVQGAFVRDFCTRPTKNRGSEMCDVLLGVPRCVTKGDRGGRGSKLAKNSVTYFMDGPFACTYVCMYVCVYMHAFVYVCISSQSYLS